MEEQTRRVSFEQMTALMDFMGQHKELASGEQRTTEARHVFKRQWNELAKTLNVVRGGTLKTPDLWSRYWSDFKNKLKKKVKLLDRRRKHGWSGTTKPLTKLERRALVILGPKFSKLSRDGNRNYFKDLPTPVKLENFQDVDCPESSECSDRLSDGGGDCLESDPEDNGDEMELEHHDISDPAIQNIYPKWLIEVEKKRANAELCRAESEKQRTTIALQQTDAAVTQAEALKRLSEATVMQAQALERLSEAATIQANALMRIATFLESRGHNASLLTI